jgi:hypothetical protein
VPGRWSEKGWVLIVEMSMGYFVLLGWRRLYSTIAGSRNRTPGKNKIFS